MGGHLRLAVTGEDAFVVHTGGAHNALGCLEIGKVSDLKIPEAGEIEPVAFVVLL
jgi:hypothetical protein